MALLGVLAFSRKKAKWQSTIWLKSRRSQLYAVRQLLAAIIGPTRPA
jgi:hypothetical protein